MCRTSALCTRTQYESSSLYNTVTFTKQPKMRQAGMLACMGKSEILRSPQGKRQLRKSRRRLEGNKRINLKELGCKSTVVSAWSAEETATTIRKQYARQRQTDIQTDRQTHRQTGRQADRQTHRQEGRQTDREIGKATALS